MSISGNNQFSFVMIGRIVSAALQALFYLIFAAFLEPESYGNLSYLIALAGTFSIISRFGLNHSVTVYQAKNNLSFVKSINNLALITSLIASVILLTIDLFAAVLCFGMTLYVMNIHNLLGLKKYKKYMWIEVIRGIFIISIPFPLYFILDISGLLLGISISYIICSIDFFKFLSLKRNIFAELKTNSKTLIHNFGVDFSIRAPRFIDKLIIFPILGFTNLGIYQLNVQILFGLEILPLALHSFLLSEESSGKKHNKINYLIILSSVVIAFLAIFISPFFINEFFQKYSLGIPSLQILVIAIIPLTISSILNAKLQSKESTIVGYSAIVRIGSMLILIPILGGMFDLIGLSLAVLLSIIFYTISLCIIYKKSSNIINK